MNKHSVPQPTGQEKGRRTYRSARRTEQARHTRARIIDAAHATFLRSGYVATTMRAVAATAHVSVQTVELVFGRKPELLKAVIDVTIAGDDQPVPTLRRDAARGAERAADVGEFIEVVAAGVRVVADRVSGILLVLDQAAAVDESIAELARRLDDQRATVAAWIVRGLHERAALRAGCDAEQATDIVWLLMDPAVFRRLTRDRGWDGPQFQRWFAHNLRELLRHPA